MKGRRQAQAGGAAEAGIMWSAGSRWPIRMQTVADRLLTRCLSAEIGSRPTEVDNRSSPGGGDGVRRVGGVTPARSMAAR